MPDKTDSEYSLFENYETDESSFQEDLQQDLKEDPLEDDSAEDLQPNLEQDQNQILTEDLPEDLQQELSEEFIRELENDIQQNPEQDLIEDLIGDLSEDLVKEGVPKTSPENLELSKPSNSFSHYTKYSSKKTRSRFFNWCIGFAKLCLFIMLMPIILFIISMVGGAILSLLITGIGLIGSSLVTLIGAAFYFTSLTKTVVLLLIALSVTFFSFGLIIFLLGVICTKKLVIFIINYYKTKREKKQLAKEANAL